MRQPPEFVDNCGLLPLPLHIFKFRMCQNNHLVITDLCKILCKPVVNLAFNEIMSFEIQRMSSGRVIRLFKIQAAKTSNGQKNSSAKESILNLKGVMYS